MAPHRAPDSAGTETSETEHISGTESFSSEHSAVQKLEIDPNVSFDSLFSSLAQEARKSQYEMEKEDEYAQIKKSVYGLPKIETKFEEKSVEVKPKKIVSIEKLNDPIVSKRAPKKQIEDSGSKWFNMREPEITPQMKRDLLIIKQRNALDPKRHYKKEKWQTPKYFQMGTIVEGNIDPHSARMNRKQRGTTMVEEILNDGDSKKYFGRKYSEIQSARTSGKKAHYKKVKEARKRY